jgi:hypothetical protein
MPVKHSLPHKPGDIVESYGEKYLVVHLDSLWSIEYFVNLKTFIVVGCLDDEENLPTIGHVDPLEETT